MEVKTRFEIACRTNSEGNYVLYLRFTANNKKRKAKTHVQIPDNKFWEPQKQRVSSRCPGFRSINTLIAKEIDTVNKIIVKLEEEKHLTIDNLYIMYTTGGVGEKSLHDFGDYIRHDADLFLARGQLQTEIKIRNLIRKLDDYVRSKNRTGISFADLSPLFLRDFEAWLRSKGCSRYATPGLHPNTIHKLLSVLRAVLNRAVCDGILNVNDNPFNVYKLHLIPTTKEKLNTAEINALANLNLPKGTREYDARNMFMFSFYCAGIRVADLLALKWSNIENGRLHYSMGKNGKYRDLILVPAAMQILEEYYNKCNVYVFPLLTPGPYSKYNCREEMPVEVKQRYLSAISSATTLLNKALASISVKAGLTKKVTSHIARHSFAAYAKNNGVDNLAVKDLLAHSSIATTERYMGDFSTQHNDTILLNMFSGNKEANLDKLLSKCRNLNNAQLNNILNYITEQVPECN